MRRFIDRKQYIVLHAARQVGKTTAIRALAHALTQEGRYAAITVSVEQGQPFDDIGAAELAVLGAWRLSADELPEALRPPAWPEADPGNRIGAALAAWARACPRPLVLFIDEVDALRDDVLVSLLCQLRSGHLQRPRGFPWSIVLVGLRDVCKHDVARFDVAVASIHIRNFTRDEVAELYAQHTADTGQEFEPGAVERAFELSAGQPGLVNALARAVVERLRPNPNEPIRAEDIDRAARVLIDGHHGQIGDLSKRLREPRIRAIIEPMLAGETPGDIPRDDLRFAVELGLLRMAEFGGLELASPIYRELIGHSYD